jgi:hypothetical protein
MSRWVRRTKRSYAQREDDLIVELVGFQWVVRYKGKAKILKTDGAPAFIEKAIREADEKLPPAGWRLDPDGWKRENWRITETTAGEWSILRANRNGEYEPASGRAFPSADRARAWCDVRMDRGEAGLRGPKPRTGLRANSKLPDVRVTQDEKESAMEILERVNMTYAEFVRASLRWVDENVGDKWRVVDTDSGPAFAPGTRAKDTP